MHDLLDYGYGWQRDTGDAWKWRLPQVHGTKNTSKNSFSDFQGLWTGFCTIQDLRWEKNNLVQRIPWPAQTLAFLMFINCFTFFSLFWWHWTLQMSFNSQSFVPLLPVKIHIYLSRCCFYKCFLWLGDYIKVSDGQITRIDFPFSLLLPFLPKQKLIETASRYRIIYLSVWYCCANFSVLRSW